MNPLEFHAITKTFDGFELGPIDLTIPQGYVTGLVGVNGAGKTTLIKLALGLLHPTSGSVSVIDKGRIGVVLDTPALVPNWTVRDVARAIARFYPTWSQAEFDRVAAWGNLASDKQVKELSRGMGMKLQLAIAMAHGADLLILDEPTSGLDPLARSELLDMIAEFMTDERHSVLFSTHITTDLERVADHLAVLHSGRVLAAGPLSTILDDFRFVRGATADLDAMRPLVHGLREHAQGWEGLLATEHTVGLAPGTSVQTPTIDQLVVHLSKEPSHA